MASVTTVEYANEILRKLFLGQYHKSLLILDDVWSSQIIKSFDVCAKVLVTTQDITVLDVISKNNVNVVKMQPFTQEESLKVQKMTKNGFLKQFDFEVKSFGKSIDFFFVLQLFSSYVDIPIEFLPEEAKDIHSECKGSPMVISMIGGLISESGRHSQRQRQSGRWGYYLNSLQSRKFSMSQFFNFRARKS